MDQIRSPKRNMNEPLLRPGQIVYVPSDKMSTPGSSVHLNNHFEITTLPDGQNVIHYQPIREWSVKPLIPMLILVLMNVLYVISLEPCPNKPQNWVECKKHYVYHVIPWLIEVFMSAGAYFILIYMAIKGAWSHLYPMAGTVCLFYYMTTYNEFIMANHGGIIKWLFIIMFIVISLVFIIKELYCHTKYIPVALLIAFILMLPVFSAYYTRVSTSVEGWEVGVGGRKLINDGQHCTVPIPTYSEFQARRGLLDVNALLPECSTIDEIVQKDLLPENLRNKTDLKMIGYPRTEYYTNYERIHDDAFMVTVLSQIVDMDDEAVPQSVKDNIEFTVDMTDPLKHKLNVNVKRNDTRAAEQKKLRDEIIANDKKIGKTDRIDKNVFMFYIDNLSRAQFKRKLPKTVEWLSQYVDNPEEDIELFQFFRYHSVYYNTHFNNDAIWYGQIGAVSDMSENVFDSFSRNGYITGWFEDGCETAVNDFTDETQTMHHWDHMASGIGCDQNFDQLYFFNSTISKIDPQGRRSTFRHCLYGQTYHNMILDYAKQFWEAYPDNRKFFRTHFSDAHEVLGELIKYFDDDIVAFLQWFKESGYLDDTYLIFIADHGAHNVIIRTPMFPDNARNVENTHPYHLDLVKKDIPEKYLQNLRNNEQSFMSNHDLYSTLKTIAEGSPQTSKYALSYPYIAEQLPIDRDCTNSTMFLARCWCYMDPEQAQKELDSIWLFNPVIRLYRKDDPNKDIQYY